MRWWPLVGIEDIGNTRNMNVGPKRTSSTGRRQRAIGFRVLTTVVALTILTLSACTNDTLGEVFSFADRLDDGTHRRDLLRYEFNAYEARYRLSGWSSTEMLDGGESFVWAIGREAQLVLQIGDPHDLRWLHFKSWPLNFGSGQRQYVRMNLNGTFLGVVELGTCR